MEKNKNMLRVCYFGTYKRDCPRCKRNALLISGLRKNGVEVVECNEALWERKEYKGDVVRGPISKLKLILKIIKRYISLVFKYRKLGHFDAVIIGYPGYFDIYLARLLNIFNKRKIILDAYISFYEAAISDRKMFREGSLMAHLIYYIEKLGCSLADLVLVETQGYVSFFNKFYGLKENKLRGLLSTANDELFFPREAYKNSNASFEVLYYGSFIPMHGLEYIIDAAECLKDHSDIKFRLVGDGQLREAIEARLRKLSLRNVILDRWYEPEELVGLIANSDLCLGVFGGEDKTKRCFTNKVCDALAMKKPIITCDSPTTRQLFIDGHHLILSPVADGNALAKAILYLKDNPDKRREIAEAGHKLYLDKFSSLKIGGELKEIIIALAKR